MSQIVGIINSLSPVIWLVIYMYHMHVPETLTSPPFGPVLLCYGHGRIWLWFCFSPSLSVHLFAVFTGSRGKNVHFDLVEVLILMNGTLLKMKLTCVSDIDMKRHCVNAGLLGKKWRYKLKVLEADEVIHIKRLKRCNGTWRFITSASHFTIFSVSSKRVYTFI